jgi:zinc/manganese transport system permease protein
LLSGNPHGAEHFKELLEGQILWVAPTSLLPVAVLYLIVLGLWFGVRARLGATGFYASFALTVTASVQLVGVYLVFASLIIPALAVSRLPARRRLPLAWTIGALAYGGGLLLSLVADLPAAPVIVCLLALVGAVAYAATPAPRA